MGRRARVIAAFFFFSAALLTRWGARAAVSATMGGEEGGEDPTGSTTVAELGEGQRAWGVLVLLTSLAVCLVVAHFLEGHSIGRYLHESAATVIISAFMGLIFRFTVEAALSRSEREKFDLFDTQFFFIILLPPIIFEAGYSMRRNSFFRNFGTIMLFAVVGTAISAFIIGLGVFGMGFTPLVYKMPFVESMMYGSLISAVDPVTVIAIFTEMKLDGTLFSLIFGESIMNDAVCIVLFRTMEVFIDHPFNVITIVKAVGVFFLIFIGSFGIGIGAAMLAALLFKVIDMREHPHVETAVFFIAVYAPYLIAEALELSGIVAILFCGITMAHYAYYNLSRMTQDVTKHICKVMAYVAETTVFAYLGLSLFTFEHKFEWGLIALTILLCFISRACNIFPLSFVANFFRKDVKVSLRHQGLLYWGGLRGAIAFALAVSVPQGNPHRPQIISAALITALFTIFVFGSTIYSLVRLFKIRGAEECEKELEDQLRARSKAGKLRRSGPARFMDFDKAYLQRFFRRVPGGRGDPATILARAEEQLEDAREARRELRPAPGPDDDELEEIELGTISRQPEVPREPADVEDEGEGLLSVPLGEEQEEEALPVQ